MKNNTQGKILNILIDKYTKNVERYTHNDSTWLIFTDEKKWVIELTKEGTLWYNYYFFQNIMKLLSLDVVENQHYITEWVEDTIINPVKHTDACQIGTSTSIEDAIQNGVKHIQWWTNQRKNPIEDTIQNGVKETKHNPFEDGLAMEEAIQNGVKHTEYGDWEDGDERFDDIIQNGVKRTELGGKDRKIDEIKDIVENGVKLTNKSLRVDGSCVIEEVIENGVKETIPSGYLGSVEMKGKTVHQFESPRQNNEVEDVIKSGVKATTTNYWLSEDKNQLIEIEDVIKNGIKKTEGGILFDESKIDRVISEGIKETHDDAYHHIGRVEGVITNGIVETKQEPSQRTWMSEEVINKGIKDTVCGVLEIYNPIDFEPELSEMKRMNEVNIVLDKGIKETKTPNHENPLEVLDFLKYNETDSVPNIIDEVIQNGIKEVKELPDKSGELKGYGDYYHRQEDRTKPHTKYVDDVITNGIKNKLTYDIDNVIVDVNK